MPLLLGLTCATAGAPGDQPALSVADLADYRAALEGPESPAPAVPATFRDLWARPASYRGKRVRVEGRAVRRFRQPAVGTFPALTELWVVARSGDPLCLVFPTPDEADVEPGAAVEFEGTYVKPVRYAAADEPRIAPLIVGPRPPTAHAADPAAGALPRTPFAGLDWAVGGVVAALVVLILIRHARARPARRPAGGGPAPAFTDGPEG